MPVGNKKFKNFRYHQMLKHYTVWTRAWGHAYDSTNTLS